MIPERGLLLRDPIDRAQGAWATIQNCISEGGYRRNGEGGPGHLEIWCVNQAVVLPCFPGGPFQHDRDDLDMLRAAASAMRAVHPGADPIGYVARAAASYLLGFVDGIGPESMRKMRYDPIGPGGLPSIGIWKPSRSEWCDVETPVEARMAAAKAFPLVVTPERIHPIGWSLKLHDEDVHLGDVTPMSVVDAMRITAGARSA